MCTVTVIRHADGGLRLVSSRDELRRRPASLSPETYAMGGARVLMPRDAQAGGTWIAANDRGVVMTMLNFNQGRAAVSGSVSRGSVIPEAIQAARGSEAIEIAAAMHHEEMAPFRLVVAHASDLYEARWSGRSFDVIEHAIDERGVCGAVGTACFASSGLGDALVEPRLDLWASWTQEQAISSELQDAFHDHQWPDRPEISVRMEREAARTVSVTAVDVRPEHGIEMHYQTDGVRSVVRLSLGETAAVGVPMGEVIV